MYFSLSQVDPIHFHRPPPLIKRRYLLAGQLKQEKEGIHLFEWSRSSTEDSPKLVEF